LDAFLKFNTIVDDFIFVVKVSSVSHSIIQTRFSNSSHTYQETAKIQSEIGRRLCDRFDYYTIEPTRILDLGAGPGIFSLALKKRFPKAHVTAFDLSHEMLKQVKSSWRRPVRKVAGDMQSLPFKSDSFDVIFSNQVIHWAQDCVALFKEVKRVLTTSGVFVFSTLGPDTFHEIRIAWQGVDEYSHVNAFVDLHAIGDELINAGFAEPVMDMERISVRYSSVKSLAKDLKAQGVQHHGQAARQGLMSPKVWRQFNDNYERFRDQYGLLPLSYEVVYGQAWGQAPKQSINQDGDVMVPLSRLRRG
jgi:malonyl-CoA O-methyltransferase